MIEGFLCLTAGASSLRYKPATIKVKKQTLLSQNFSYWSPTGRHCDVQGCTSTFEATGCR